MEVGTLTAFERLLVDFNLLPKQLKAKTYLGTCKYPGSRFEEVCSRLLAFFFDYKEEHGFGNLVLKSFLESAGKSDLNSNCRSIKLEHPCKRDEGEVTETTLRLDIMIRTQDAIIGIEHKINAPLYNDIATYKKELQYLEGKHGLHNHYAFVLSLRSISIQEIQKLIDSSFIPVQYLDFIKQVKNNMKGINHDKSCKYAFMLNDFLDTLESYKNSIMNRGDKFNFYQSNRKDIQTLVDEYNLFKQEVKEAQIQLFQKLLLLANEVNIPKSKFWSFDYSEEFDENKIFIQELLKDQPIGLELSIKSTTESPTGFIELHLVYWANEIDQIHKELWALFKNNIKHFENKNEINECSDGNKGLISLYLFEQKDLSDSNFKTIIKYYEDEFSRVLNMNWDFDKNKLKAN